MPFVTTLLQQKKEKDKIEEMQKYFELLPKSQQKKFEKVQEKKKKPTFFQRVISAIMTGETGQAAYDLLQGKNPITSYGNSIVEGLKGTAYDNRTYADVLEKLGMNKHHLSDLMPWLYNETGKGIKFKKGGWLDPTDTGTLGLALDILGDPKTYMGGLGLFMRAGKGMKGLTKAGVEATEQITKSVERKIGKMVANGADEYGTKVAKLLESQGEALAKLYKSSPDKYFKGITFMGKEIIPRKFALAPGRIFDKTMGHIPIVNKVYDGAKFGVQDIFKYGADMLRQAKKFGNVGEYTAESFLRSRNKAYKQARYAVSEIINDLKDPRKDFYNAIGKKNVEAARTYITDMIEKGFGDVGFEKTLGIDKLSRDALKYDNIDDFLKEKLLKRVEEFETKLDFDKPHGLYVSHGFKHGSTEVFTNKKNSVFNFILDNNKKIKLVNMEDVGLIQTPRGLSGASAGITYLKKILPKEKFNFLMMGDKDSLIKYVKNEFPKVDWDRYYDGYEVLEGYAGLKARKNGIDVLKLEDKEFPELSESVILNKNVIKNVTENEIKTIWENAHKKNKDIIPMVDNIIEKIGQYHKGFYGKEAKADARLGNDIYKEVSGYIKHAQTKWAKKVNAYKNVNLMKYKSWKNWSSQSEKGRELFRWVDDAGNVKEGTSNVLGLRRVEPIKGMYYSLTEGEHKTIQAIQKELKKWGYDLEFKPQARVDRTSLGYFDPTRKKIVIASARPSFDDIMEVIKHETIHNTHFQYGGMLEMLETFTGRKGTLYAKAKATLDAAKSSARRDWEKIFQVSQGVSPKGVKESYKTYFRKPTELLAFAQSGYAKNPELAMKMYPETVKYLEELKKTFNFLDIDKLYKQGDTIIDSNTFIDKAGKIWKRDRHMTISEINKMMQPMMDDVGVELGFGKEKKFLETDPFELTLLRGQESAKKVAFKEHIANMAQRFGRKSKGAVQITEKGNIKKVYPNIIDEKTGIRYVDPKIKELPEGTMLPDFMVGEMKKAVKHVNNEDTIAKVLEQYDKVLNFWKGTVYGWYPASHGRNFIGGTWNNFLANPKAFLPKFNNKTVKKILRGDDGSIKIAGKEIPFKTLREKIYKSGVLEQTGYLDVNDLNKSFNKSWYKKVGDLPMNAMEMVENNLRIPLFLAELDDGKSFADAAQTVFKYHFDYAPESLSEIERNILRRFIPFYKWQRMNAPLMIEEFIAQPAKQTALFKFMRDAQDDMGEEMQQYLPSYLEKQGAITRGGQTISGYGLPPIEMLQWLDQPLHQAESGLTPFVKVPLELRTNYSLFKDKVISEDNSGEFARYYDKMPGGKLIKNFLEWEDASYEKNGKTIQYSRVNPWRKYMLYALPTGRVASIMAKMTDDEAEKNKALYALTGIRTIQLDLQKQKEYAEKKFEKELLKIMESAGLYSKYGTPYKSTKEKLSE